MQVFKHVSDLIGKCGEAQKDNFSILAIKVFLNISKNVQSSFNWRFFSKHHKGFPSAAGGFAPRLPFVIGL